MFACAHPRKHPMRGQLVGCQVDASRAGLFRRDTSHAEERPARDAERTQQRTRRALVSVVDWISRSLCGTATVHDKHHRRDVLIIQPQISRTSGSTKQHYVSIIKCSATCATLNTVALQYTVISTLAETVRRLVRHILWSCGQYPLIAIGV